MSNYVSKTEAEKKLNSANLEKAGAGRKVNARMLALLPMAVALFIVPSFATETPANLANVTAQVSNATSLVGNVFDLITGNAYLALIMAFGLLGAAVRLFRKVKRAAR